MTRPKDEIGSEIVSSESDISHPIRVYLSWNNNSKAQARRFPALTAPEPEFPVIFGSKWDALTSAWRQQGASPERLAELPTDVPPLQKRIWKWDFYHCFSCNFFFHIFFNIISMHQPIGLASDDVTKLSTAWQQRKLVLNKDRAPYKSMLGENSLPGGSSFFLLGEIGTVWQLLHGLVRHISKDVGDRTSAGPFFSRSTISQHAFVWGAIFV